ncbi:MAG: hypothetical protein ACD_79C00456G0004, partial [uncultured bacterium]
ACVLMKNRLPEKMHSIKMGTNDLQFSVLDKRKNNQVFDVLTIKHNTKAHEILTQLKNEILKTFISFTKDKYPILITGNVENFINLDKFIENEKTTHLLSDEKLEENKKIKSQAISIGLALTMFSNESEIVQFRNQEFAGSKKIFEFGKKIFNFCSIILFILIAFYTISSWIIARKETLLCKNLQQICELENKELNKDENIHISNPYYAIDKYEKKLLKETKDFPYFLKTTNVSKSLSWINNHEQLKAAEILYFNYDLEKYPNVTEKKEPYIVKVELEFKTKTPAIARCFYDSLTKGEGLVDPGDEITWEVLNDHYKTSFYLKSDNPKK